LARRYTSFEVEDLMMKTPRSMSVMRIDAVLLD